MKRALLILVAVLVVFGAGFALTSGGESAAEEKGRAVPDVSVAGLSGDGELALRSLDGAATPTLLWFWAPWCGVCNTEAPAIERLAAESRGDLAVVAIGGRAKAPEGQKFVARHRLRTPALQFDEPMAAWQAYRIPAQPGAVLLDRNGRERQRWLGAFDTAEALAAARAL